MLVVVCTQLPLQFRQHDEPHLDTIKEQQAGASSDDAAAAAAAAASPRKGLTPRGGGTPRDQQKVAGAVAAVPVSGWARQAAGRVGRMHCVRACIPA